MKRIKVLHLTSTPKGLGGAEKLLVDMADKYDPARFDVEHCNIFSEAAEGDVYEKMLRQKGAKVHTISGKGYADLPQIIKKLRRLLIAGQFDILHAQMLHATIVGSFVARTVRGLRFVITKQYTNDHISSRKLLFFLDGVATKRADRVLAISRAVRDEQVDRGFPAGKIVMAPNAVDTTPFISKEIVKDLDSGKVKILTIGNLHKRKGHAFLLKALGHTIRESENIFLDIAGEGPERRALQEQIKTLGIEEKVKLLGYVSDIPGLLAESDIYVHPSASEPFGIAIIEAMASRLCVIATNVGGVSDIIENDGNGILIEYGDDTALRENLQHVISNKGYREKLSFQAVQTVQKKFSISVTVGIYQKVYADLIFGAA